MAEARGSTDSKSPRDSGTLPVMNNQMPKKVSQQVPCQLRHFMKKFNMTDSTMKEIYSRFCAQVRKGLAKATHQCSDIKCFISYVHNLPTGKEHGKCLALDLGGSNFRVLLVILNGNKEPVINNKIFEISQDIMRGTAVKLFDYIAKCLADFAKEMNVHNETLPLGFTFSFPCLQTGLKTAKLVKWTKGFDVEGVVDQDVGKLLTEAISRRNDLKVEISAVVNDTVGTLMSCAFKHKTCRIGLIVGTGTNACYVEKTENCQLLEAPLKRKFPEVVINCEWGAFGENGDLDFVQNEYDREVDSKTVNPSSQIFEKMISGMYLGEILRLVLRKAIQNKLIFAECSQPHLMKILSVEGCIQTKHLSKIERDKFPSIKYTEEVIREIFQLKNPKPDDSYKLLYIAGCISRRSAAFVGIGLAALVNKMGNKHTTIGVDGTLYKKHPKYECYICKTMKKLVDKRYRYKLVVSEDGSGLGASIVAAVEMPNKRKSTSQCPP